MKGFCMEKRNLQFVWLYPRDINAKMVKGKASSYQLDGEHA